MSEGLAIHLLGPVTGSLGDAAIDLGAARQRAVLAMLASPPGRVVTMGQLVEGLWGDGAPPSAEQSVYTYVAGLRRALEPGRGPGRRSTVLVGEAGGYRLLLDPGQVDSCAFAELLEPSGQDEGALRALDQALALWRGVALSGLTGPFAEAERARLDELFLNASESRAELLVRLGRAREAVAPLRELTARHPLRERLHELLMLALHGDGRQAEALRAFEEARRILDGELGALPGAGLRAAHRLVLSGGEEEPEPARPAVPRQLPRDLIGFVGRVQEVARLRSLLAPEDGPPHPFVVISGPPGVGKSALAVHVAHRVEERFPDGQLALGLRGGTPNGPPLSAHEIAGRLLRGIGVSNEDVPVDLDEAAAMWRSRLHGRRLLVLLDNAAGLAQVRPFLGTPLGVTVLVTSRESFSAGDDCVQLRLRPLTASDAAAMLTTLAGAERVSADAGQTEALVGLCDGLPLALRIAGARLADHPEWSVDDVAELGVTLTFALIWHQQREQAGQEMIELNTLALGVCERLGDETRALVAHDHIANGLRLTGRLEQAVTHLEAALELAARVGDSFGELRALGNLANLCVARRRFEPALGYAERQLAVARRIGSQVGIRFALVMIGKSRLGLGRAREAYGPFREALDSALEASDETQEAYSRLSLGEVLIELGDPEAALEHLRAAATLLDSKGQRFSVDTLILLSRATRALGRLDEALSHADRAVYMTKKFGHTLWKKRAEKEQAAVREAMRTAAGGS